MTEQLIEALPLLVFLVTGTVAVASSILVVAMRNAVHSALFLLLTFLCVAVLFILAQAEFVGAVQLLVYAGGIMVLFLFVVMLVNVRQLSNEKMISPYWKGAAGVGAVLFILFASVIRGGAYKEEVAEKAALRAVPSTARTATGERIAVRREVGNTEAVGMALYQDYLVPFEVASLFLLVAMIGAIVIGKRELLAEAEDKQPDFVTKRVEEEKRVKEAIGA